MDDLELTIDNDLEYWRGRKIKAELYVYIHELSTVMLRSNKEDELAERLRVPNRTLSILSPILNKYLEDNR
jgi:hypothetical protein